MTTKTDIAHIWNFIAGGDNTSAISSASAAFAFANLVTELNRLDAGIETLTTNSRENYASAAKEINRLRAEKAIIEKISENGYIVLPCPKCSHKAPHLATDDGSIIWVRCPACGHPGDHSAPPYTSTSSAGTTNANRLNGLIPLSSVSSFRVFRVFRG